MSADLGMGEHGASDHAVTAFRMMLGVVPGGALLLELLPTAGSRQTARAIESMGKLILQLQDRVSAADWRRAIGTEEFDAAFYRSFEAAKRASSEEKRRTIWFALVNGWVRSPHAANRERLLRLVEAYGLEEFAALKVIHEMGSHGESWIPFESGPQGRTIVSCLAGSREESEAIIQRFSADGLVRDYDQPMQSGSGDSSHVTTKRIILVRPLAGELLRFVEEPLLVS